MCIPIFVRTARFDIQPNRFGILGQFGPDRKLQLASTNLTAMVGWDARLMPNASIELEVYVSNASHVLQLFEYTKENNAMGVQLTVPTPSGGWRAATWTPLTIPITDSSYAYPATTPWDHMDRLELYYSNPNPQQVRGDYIRIRNVYVRSTRSYNRASDAKAAAATAMQPKGKQRQQQQQRACRELDMIDQLTKLHPPQHTALPAESTNHVEIDDSTTPLHSALVDQDGSGAMRVHASSSGASWTFLHFAVYGACLILVICGVVAAIVAMVILLRGRGVSFTGGHPAPCHPGSYAQHHTPYRAPAKRDRAQ